jgi:hypothetical protein
MTATDRQELEEMAWLWFDLLPPGEVEEWEIHEYVRLIAINMGWDS